MDAGQFRAFHVLQRVIDEKGILLPIAGEFAGQHIKKARLMIVEKLRQKGLLVKVDEKYTHNVATSYRGGGIIEPQIKKTMVRVGE
jgi:valyl-tRNA synthetase